MSRNAPFACDAAALDPATRVEHFRWIRHELPRLVSAVKKVPNGVALRLPLANLASVMTFVDRERRCCPFLRFELVLPAGEEVFWLQVTVPKGGQQVLSDELHL